MNDEKKRGYIMKKIKKLVVTVLSAMALMMFIPSLDVYASGTVSVSVSASTVNIGDTVTVTAHPSGPSGEAVNAFLTFTYDSSKFSFVSCSEGSNYGGGGGGTVTVTGVESASITLKATAAGSASVSVAGTDLVASADGTTEYGEASAGGTSITINNAAAESTSTSSSTATDNQTTATTDISNLSGDNSLKSLTLSAGTLSPAFQYNVTKYTATVGADVTSIAVSAEPSNENATVESVSGNENIVEGNNIIQIVVKAQNGVTATYTITVTKTTTTDTKSEEEQESETEETEETEDTEKSDETSGIVVNEVAYNISEDFAASAIPEDFSETTVTYQGKDYRGVAFDKGNVVMLYLVPEEGDGTGAFFVYDQSANSFCSFTKITYGEKYLIALLAPQDTAVPSTYAQTQLDLGDTGSITAYQQAGEDGTVSEFFQFYAINSDGTEGWYQYDSTEGTYQRWNGTFEEEEEEEDTTDLEYLQNQYNNLSDKYTADKAKMRKVAAVLIVVCVILLIIVINLLLRGGRKGESVEYEEDEDDALEEEKEVDVIDTSRRPRPNEDDLSDELPEEEEEAADEAPEEEETQPEKEPATKPKKGRKKEKVTDEEDDDLEVLDLNDL